MGSWPCVLFLKREFTEVGDDNICTVRSEVGGVIASSNANHKPEPAGRPASTPTRASSKTAARAGGVFEPPGRFQEHVRRRLAQKTEPSKIDAVYANVKELGKARRIEYPRTVLRR